MAHLSAGADKRNWFVREKALLEQWKYLKELGLNTSGEGRPWTTCDLMVRRTGEPTAVRRGTLLLPDCAVMTSPGLREFDSMPLWLGPLECGRLRPVSAG
jgi:hypothetical protein